MKPAKGAILAAYPWSDDIGAVRMQCRACGDFVSIDPKNVSVIAECELIVMCLLCAALLEAMEPVNIRGRLRGGKPIDEIADNN